MPAMAENPPPFGSDSYSSAPSNVDTDFARRQLEYWQSVVNSGKSGSAASQSRSPSTSREAITSPSQGQRNETNLQRLLQPAQHTQPRNNTYQSALDTHFSYDRLAINAQTSSSALDNLRTPVERSSYTQPIAPSDEYRVHASTVANITTPLFTSDTERKAWLANDKRSRNTEASARFRAKKKLYAEGLQEQIASLSQRTVKMEEEIVELRRENRWLRELVVEKSQVPDGRD